MRTTVRRIIVVLVVAGALGIFYLAYRVNDEGKDDAAVVTGADAVERTLPEPGAEILRQDRIGVDLAPGYTGVLSVNDVDIPADQLDINEPLGEVTFSPGEGKAVEAFRGGENCATAEYWRIQDGRDASRTTRWCFEVT